MARIVLSADFGARIRHGFYDRHGGASLSPWESMNISDGSGDAWEAVAANREWIRKDIGARHLVSMRQEHGNHVVVIDAADSAAPASPPACDAMITACPGTGLLVAAADCQPVLLADPVRRVIAAVHNGWRGAASDILGRTLGLMRERFGCRPEDITAGVGPSLGPCCAQFRDAAALLPGYFQEFQPRPRYIDFWAVSRHQLVRRGLAPENIVVAAVCTVCSRDFFSHRRATRQGRAVTGRNGSVIVLSAAEDSP